MRTRTRSLFALASLVGLAGLAGLAGCGDILGLEGYTDGDGSIVADATSGDAQSDVVQSDVVIKDAGPEAAVCNGTSVCVPDLPSGWAFVPYDPDSRVACAAGYGSPEDVEEGIDAGNPTCGCGCTTTNPDCHTGNLTITGGSNGSCNNITNQTDVADAGCNTLTAFSTNGNSLSVTSPKPVGGSCTPSPSQTIPGVAYEHQGRACTYEAGAPGGGCDGGSVCVPNPAPFTTCIAQKGTNACPSDYPTQHFVGSAITDTRACTACTCTFDAGTCGGTATLWTNTGCNNNSTPIPATSTCTSVAGSRAWKAYSYIPQTTAACSGSAVGPDGGVAFSDLTTICCK